MVSLTTNLALTLHSRPVNLHPLFLFWKHGSVCDPEKNQVQNMDLKKSRWKKQGHCYSKREQQARVSISSGQRNLMKTYHNGTNTSGITKIALKKILDFFDKEDRLAKLQKYDFQSHFSTSQMVFCYHNCSDLLWEKFVLV